MTRTNRGGLCFALLATVLVGCTSQAPTSADDRRARGEAMVKQMSDRLAAADRISFSTTEHIGRVARDGQIRTDRLTRQVVVRRPDRLYSKVTGDRDIEIFYEGSRLTLVAHREKVFGEFKTPATLDETIDLAGDRYGIALPIGDLLTTSAHDALMSGQTTGGWAGDESVGGIACGRIEWRHPNVDWTIWIPTSGEPLPAKLHIVYKTRRGKPDATITFADWNLDAAVKDATFVRRVPADYEGIAVIQRASAVLAPGTPADTQATGAK